MPTPNDGAMQAAVDSSAPEIQALQQVINDKPNTAARLIDGMSGKERAIFAFYLRELGLMIEIADASDLADRRSSK